MLTTPRAYKGMVTAPHHLASRAGLDVLREGGNAVEAVVATAAALAAAYPHMTHIGGDGFWLISEPGRDPVAVDACGGAGAHVDADLYRRHGLDSIPWRGPLAANTVAGTVSGWAKALEVARGWSDRPLPLWRLLEPAISLAEDGFAVTESQEESTRTKLPELKDAFGFAEVFLPRGQLPKEGERMRQPALAETLRAIAKDGADDFYRGRLAKALAADLAEAGSPITAADLEAHRATLREPLAVETSRGRLFNFPPPTQGLSSLMILALFDRLGVAEAEGFDFVHGLVECTKQAFLVRDRHVTDPAYMTRPAEEFLKPDLLDSLAARVDRARALPWPAPPQAGDTVWMGAIDGQGRAVSFIQSIYFEFGSGLVLPRTGVVWQNRGASFGVGTGPNPVAPGRKPFHTLNPAMAYLKDGRLMSYGTMGGEGQPQTQAAIFARYAHFGQRLQAAVTAPRWLLGRTWGEQSVTLKLEDRFPAALLERLRAAGHDVEVLPPFTSTMGHAGALVRHPDGMIEGATDPRSDGAVAGF